MHQWIITDAQGIRHGYHDAYPDRPLAIAKGFSLSSDGAPVRLRRCYPLSKSQSYLFDVMVTCQRTVSGGTHATITPFDKGS